MTHSTDIDVRAAFERFAENLTRGIPEGIPIEALAAADEAAWFDVHMDRGEADRRLAAALVAAKPYIEAAARRDERRRTIREIITRLEGIEPKDSYALAHLRSILPESD